MVRKVKLRQKEILKRRDISIKRKREKRKEK
jgi:hypothetical protein